IKQQFQIRVTPDHGYGLPEAPGQEDLDYHISRVQVILPMQEQPGYTRRILAAEAALIKTFQRLMTFQEVHFSAERILYGHILVLTGFIFLIQPMAELHGALEHLLAPFLPAATITRDAMLKSAQEELYMLFGLIA